MADIFTRNNLSNGGVNTGSTFTTPQFYSSGPSPSQTIRSREADLSTARTLSYPADLPKYYLGMSINSYQRNSLLEMGYGNHLYTIGLPLPDHMVDMNNVTYNKDSFKALVGNVLNASMSSISDASGKLLDGDGKGALESAGNAFNANTGKAAAISAGIDAVSGIGGPDAINAIKSATGYAPNYFLSVLLDGPQYKSFAFSWTFSPRNPAESAELTKILRTIKNAQAVGIHQSGAFFKFPRIFRCWYSPDRAHLYQFKPAVLESFTVDYSGGGTPSMFQPRPETNNWAAPSVIKAQATFTELEFWLRSDFGSETDITDNFPNQENTSPGPTRNSD